MADRLLKEDGSGLLLETGDSLLLETGSSNQTLSAGVQALTVTAPTAALEPGPVTLAAGTTAITVTAPTASIRMVLHAGTPSLTITAPPARILGMFWFQDQVTVAAALTGPRFRDQVRIVQAPLASFRDTVAIRRALQPFSDRLRILPADIRTLFDSDIQRPVGRVEEV